VTPTYTIKYQVDEKEFEVDIEDVLLGKTGLCLEKRTLADYRVVGVGDRADESTIGLMETIINLNFENFEKQAVQQLMERV
jgi:hypothetical protein